ncbi:Anoctamin-5 [Entomortierella beljakovae]|nr:Anoctamin-5 [Entomortierella beljakovae]
MDTHTHQRQKQRKSRQDKRQLHPKSTSSYYTREGSISSTPSSPVTPVSSRSVKSHHSSIRRRAAMSIISESAVMTEETEDLESIKVTYRVLSNYRVVHLFYQKDIDLFDAILEWKENNPSHGVDEAISVFATDKGSDALVHLVYSTEAFDIVLKYDSADEDLTPLLRDKPDDVQHPNLSGTIDSLSIKNQVSSGQPGLEQRREAVLFKVERLTDFHLAEAGRRWCDVVRHSGGNQEAGQSRGSGTGTDGRPGFFQTSRRGFLVRSIIMAARSRKSQNGRKMGLRSALRHGVYQKLYALHDGPFKPNSGPTNNLNHRAQLRFKWANLFWGSQPLDLVNTYFGERIGIYFAWLGHYTKWLTIPAVVGVSVFIFGIVNASRSKKLDATPNVLFAIFDNVLTMPFALFMSVWSTVYIEFWKRANQYYSFRWNMSDYERVELPRTEFTATKSRYSPVVTVIGSVACLMIFKAWFKYHFGGLYTAVMATAMLNLIMIVILGEVRTKLKPKNNFVIWCWLAEWLTDKENHKYTNTYENSLIIKRYIFDFTNMYSTLFYYAFFKAPLGSKVFKYRPDLQDQCMYDACITELTVQLAVVFIGKQFLNGLFEMIFPLIMRAWNRKKILADQALKRHRLFETRKCIKTPQWVRDDNLPSYEGRILKCYRKTVIQFGFCTLFVTSFPLAPAFALINNWIGIRMEASRLLTQYRRPIALRAQDIGMWEQIIEFISFVSVITNASIIAFSSFWIKQNLFVKWLKVSSDGEMLAARLGFILVFEHVVYLFKFILRAAIPTVPLTIKLAVQRSKYMARVASEGLDSELDGTLDLDNASDSQSGDECSEPESKLH